jgi:hypothetical protein
VGAELFLAEEQTDRHDKPIVAVRNSVDAPKRRMRNITVVRYSYTSLFGETMEIR